MALKDRYSTNNWQPDWGLKDRYGPEDFTTEQHYMDTFGNSETEVSARWVIMFLQDRKRGWGPFTYKEINAFYNKTRGAKGHVQEDFWFNRLIPGKHQHMTAHSFPMGETRENDWVICPTNPDGTPVDGLKDETVLTVTERFIYPLVTKGYLKDEKKAKRAG